MNLYAIPHSYRAWSDAIEANDGEVTAEAEKALAEIQGTLESRADAVAALVREAEREEECYRSEATHFAAKATYAKNRAERLKRLLLEAMTATGTDRVEGDRFTVSAHAGTIPAIEWDGPGEVPEWARRTKIEVDKKKVHEAYRTGATLPGFAIKHSRYIRIR